MLRSMSEDELRQGLLAEAQPLIKDEELGLDADEASSPDALFRMHKRELLNLRKKLAARNREFFKTVFVDAPQEITHATLQSAYFKSIVEILKTAALNFIDALNVMAIPIGISTVAEAFGVSPDLCMTLGMSGVLPQLILKICADNNVDYTEMLYHICSTSYRAFNFFAYVFVLYISTYLAYEQIEKGIGDDTQVDVSNKQYYLQFVMATGIVSVVYAGCLESAKNKLEASEEWYAKTGRACLEVCRSAGIAGNLNALATYALKPFGWKPAGNENEVTRFLGFESICCVSLLLQLLCMSNKTLGKYISNSVNVIAIVTYGLFVNENRKQFSNPELDFITLMFAATLIASVVGAIKFPGEDINSRPSNPRR